MPANMNTPTVDPRLTLRLVSAFGDIRNALDDIVLTAEDPDAMLDWITTQPWQSIGVTIPDNCLPTRAGLLAEPALATHASTSAHADTVPTANGGAKKPATTAKPGSRR